MRAEVHAMCPGEIGHALDIAFDGIQIHEECGRV
jgi:hypothetical protein